MTEAHFSQSCLTEFPIKTDLIDWQRRNCQDVHVWCLGAWCFNVETVRHEDVIKWKHFPRHCPFVWGIHRLPLNSPLKGRSIIIIMLLMCGEVEMNPGSVNDSIYPCRYCKLQIGWSRRALCCDSCSLWYHKTCLSMATDDYARLEEYASVSWHCLKCHTPLGTLIIHTIYQSRTCLAP